MFFTYACVKFGCAYNVYNIGNTFAFYTDPYAIL